MVVTLHACDLATDYALEKAVGWGAKVILSVPCCQHELNRQIHNPVLQPVLEYGLLKERMAALYTDGIRAKVLEYRGYNTQILEFIDMEHTPKNILLRAVLRKEGDAEGEKKKETGEQIRELIHFLNADPPLSASPGSGTLILRIALCKLASDSDLLILVSSYNTDGLCKLITHRLSCFS